MGAHGKSAAVNLRVTPQQKRLFLAAAEKLGMQLSDWVRASLIAMAALRGNRLK